MVMNPVLIHELRARMRGGQAYLLLMAIILIFGGVTLATFWSVTNVLRPNAPLTVPFAGAGNQANPGPQIDRILIAQRGAIFFLIMSLWAIIIAALIVPGATSGSIARERETHTLPLLLGTPLSPLSVAVGKLLAAGSYVALVGAASVPLFILVIMFGGIPPDQIVSVVLIFLVTTFAFTSLGVFISSISRNGLLAALATYGIVLALTVGSYLVFLLSSPLNKAVNMKYTLYFSPLAAVMSALTQTNSQLSTILGQVFREPGTRVAGEWWALGHYPLWCITTLAYLLAGVVLLLATSRVINPLRRWL